MHNLSVKADDAAPPCVKLTSGYVFFGSYEVAKRMKSVFPEAQKNEAGVAWVFRVSNLMKPMRRCVQNRWWREGRGVSYCEYERRVRQSQRRFCTQPAGLARVLPQGFVARLAHILDMHCAALRALKQNRASAAWVSLG